MRRAFATKSRQKFDLSQINNTVSYNNDKLTKMKKSKSSEELFVPSLPFFCPIAKSLRDNEKVRKILVCDDDADSVKPRLTWYEPTDGIIPTNWFEDGIHADLDYYFNQ